MNDLAGNDVEQQGRVDLAAAFRWAARLGYHESIANHFTLAVNDSGTEFLTHPFGLHFSEISASHLLRVDNHGRVLEGDGQPERSALCIHGPMHARLPHARCVLHAHPPYATALTAIEGARLLPLHQNSARFYDQVAYDDEFTHMALDFDEGERLAAALGNKDILFMANHGVTVLGRSVAEAFDKLYYLEKACENQVLAMWTGQPLKPMSHEAARRTAEQWAAESDFAEEHFNALKRILDREAPDYAH